MSDKPDGQGLTVDLMLRPEWAALEATDKDLTGVELVTNPDTLYGIVLYTVPVGKTLFISHFGARVTGAGNIGIQLTVAGAPRAQGGGATGSFSSLNKPVVADAGEAVTLAASHQCAGAEAIYGHIGGYEV